MDEQKVKVMLSEVLEGITDYTIRILLRSILFSQSNSIDWEQTYISIMTFMPELNLREEYKLDSME